MYLGSLTRLSRKSLDLPLNKNEDFVVLLLHIQIVSGLGELEYTLICSHAVEIFLRFVPWRVSYVILKKKMLEHF